MFWQFNFEQVKFHIRILQKWLLCRDYVIPIEATTVFYKSYTPESMTLYRKIAKLHPAKSGTISTGIFLNKCESIYQRYKFQNFSRIFQI